MLKSAVKDDEPGKLQHACLRVLSRRGLISLLVGAGASVLSAPLEPTVSSKKKRKKKGKKKTPVSAQPLANPPAAPAQLRVEAAVRDLTVGITNGVVLPYSPAHPTIQAKLELRDANNAISTITLSVTYEPALGAYTGAIPLPGNIAPGPYTAAIKFDDRVRTLKGQVPGIVNIRGGLLNSIPRVTLIPGDVNNDGQLTKADYDAAAACYTAPSRPETCSGETLKAADVDDSGGVNEFDINLIVRAMSR
ncbi:MAG: hypothetical protein QM692_04870 [Thermomicrobiales bacterium]